MTVAPAMDTFVDPDFRSPVPIGRVVAAIPADATAKGFYLQALVDEAASQGHYLTEYGPYRDFNDYPQREAARLLHECATRLYPDEPVGEGLRRLGWAMFPTLLRTMVGRVVYGALGTDYVTVLPHTSRGFEISLGLGSCDTEVVNTRDAVLNVRDYYLFPEHFLVGVFEGVMTHYELEGSVRLRRLSSTDADYLQTW